MSSTWVSRKLWKSDSVRHQSWQTGKQDEQGRVRRFFGSETHELNSGNDIPQQDLGGASSKTVHSKLDEEKQVIKYALKKFLVDREEDLNEKQIEQARVGYAIVKGKKHAKYHRKNKTKEFIAIEDDVRPKKIKTQMTALAEEDDIKYVEAKKHIDALLEDKIFSDVLKAAL